MKSLVFLCCFLLLSLIGYGQNKYSLTFEMPKVTLEGISLNNIHTEIKKSVESEVIFTSDVPSKLELTGKVGNTRTITGMDEVTIVEVTLRVELSFSNTRMYYNESPINGKGANAKAAINNALKKYAKVSIPNIADSIKVVLQTIYKDECSEYLNFPFGDEVSNESKLVFYQSFPPQSPCYELASSKVNEVQDKLCFTFCNNDIPKLETAIEAGDESIMRNSVNTLINANTHCACYSEVIRLAKRIRDIKNKELEAKNTPKYLQNLNLFLKNH